MAIPSPSRLALGLTLLALSQVVTADPAYIDVGTNTQGYPGIVPPTGDANTFTSMWDRFRIRDQVTATQFDSDGSGGITLGDLFVSRGHGNVEGFDFTPGTGTPSGSIGMDSEGINLANGYELSFDWENLTGEVNSVGVVGSFTIVNLSFDPANTLIDFYFDATTRAGFTSIDYDGTIGKDPTGKETFTDGELVMQVQVTGGTTSNILDASGNLITGSSNIQGEVVFAAQDFWYLDSDNDREYSAEDRTFADSIVGAGFSILTTIGQLPSAFDQRFPPSSNTDDPSQGPNGEDVLFYADSDNTGSFTFTHVSAPASLALLLGGIAGLTVLRRRTSTIG